VVHATSSQVYLVLRGMLLAKEASSTHTIDNDTKASLLAGLPDNDGNSARLRGVKWLALLFTQTALLLALQVTTGLLSNSLALLADVGHSSADVVSYGINLLAEYRKVAATAKTQDGDKTAALCSSARLDLLGSIVSAALLWGCTWVATTEALERLRASPSAAETSGSVMGQGVGLLAFAVASTATNGVTLLLYSRWHPDKDPAVLSDMRELPPPPLSIPSTRIASAGLQPLSLEMTSPQPPRRSRGRMRGPALDLCSSYTNTGSCEEGDCATKPGSCAGSTSCASHGNLTGWVNVLHRLVHPSCNATAALSNGTAERTGHIVRVPTSGANLNIDSALLHLVADMMRSATILVTAVLIEIGFVADAGRADAICAFFVAVFVAIGSVALLGRVFPILGRQFSFGSSFPAKSVGNRTIGPQALHV